VTEKLSEHPVGRAMLNGAIEKGGLRMVPDPEESLLLKGVGICATYKGRTIAIGNEKIIQERNLPFSGEVSRRYNQLMRENVETLNLVYVDEKYAGMIGVADVARTEAKVALESLSRIGIARIIMLTGDNAVVAEHTARELGITEWHAGISPEGKLNLLHKLSREGRKVAMVGDGINDAPALTRADVGLAMGGGGTAVAVEAANIVVLTDDLSRIPEMILLARRTVSVVSWDMVTWLVTNAIGFGLVWTGILGPALAAAYNFGTDFLPVLNSTRLFRNRK
jgi:P-type E1-E2 ATPase